MLKEQPWLKPSNGFKFELEQAREEGKDVSSYIERVNEILLMDDSSVDKQKLAGEIYDEIQKQGIMERYSYIEPSDLEGIKAVRPDSAALYKSLSLPGEADYDKIYGAWLGRCAGCLLGKPVEGWHRERLVGLLKETDNYPIKYYISSDIPLHIKEKYGMSDRNAWINQVEYMPEDDDTNYTLIGLKIFQRYGADFTPDDVAECWLENLPILHLCTAERVAYRNLVNCIYPPESASFRNPFREWIGAQIRADFFGYVTPGNPELGAEFAWRDACISHVKNGIYGEMFVAAMLSAAAVSSDIEDIIEAGLSQIPSKSRLTEKIRLVTTWKKEGITWEEALNRIHSIYDEKNGHHWCHTISNAMIVSTALLFGEKDFEKSLSIAVLGALDTDCNGATVGSILGMILGAKSLPEKWTAPLNDQLKSGVDGFGLVKISNIATQTVDVVKKMQK
ncbi:MAG: ADP-ribosylglycohydrolase family protein [Clostridiaceae bacterium]|jgi:ADP-ribosylglycohydrolase|nr:ADP-ribosylglycohydrolase family protein [Clostridiaceae bacterium]